MYINIYKYMSSGRLTVAFNTLENAKQDAKFYSKEYKCTLVKKNREGSAEWFEVDVTK